MPPKIKEFLGLNNKAEPRAMQPGELVQADNVDIDDRKRIRRRRDTKKEILMVNVTSAWATPDEERMFLVDDGTLFEVVGSAHDLVTLATGLDSAETYWATDGEQVFVSNDAGDLIIDRDGAFPLAIEKPDSPSVVEISGNLPAGRYLTAIVFEDSRGRQGPESGIIVVTLENDGAGLQFEDPDTPTGLTARFFVSGTNDEVLRQASQQVRDVTELGAALEEAQYDGTPPPAGGPIAWHVGRLWKGIQPLNDGTGLVSASDPYWPHIFHFGKYDFTVPGAVVGLSDIDSRALLVGTDRRIFVHNLDEGLTQLADYAMGAGQSIAVDDNGMVYFWTARGLCRALPFENMTDSVLSAQTGDRCSVGIVKHGGFERVMALTRVPASEAADNPR